MTPPVNPTRARWTVLCLLACHLGRPPAVGAWSVGRVEIAAAEPSLRPQIERAFHMALAGDRAAAGLVDLVLLESDERTLAQEPDGRRLMEVSARLQVDPHLPGIAPLVVSGAERYTTGSAAPRAAADLRSAAWRRLAEGLARTAARWLATLEPR